MKKTPANAITSCTITWESAGVPTVVTRILQTEIQQRRYNDRGELLGGSIWPMTEQQKQQLFGLLDSLMHEWTASDYSVDGCDGIRWHFKVCTRGGCLRSLHGATEPPPHGEIVKALLGGIIGEENCFLW